MATTVKDLVEWFNQGRKRRAAFMIVATDTFDWEDFPVYVKKSEDVRAKVAEYQTKSMSKVMEVYNLSKPFDGQVMNGRFCWDLG